MRNEVVFSDIPSRNRSLIWKTLKKASNFLDLSIKHSSETKTEMDKMLASLHLLISTSHSDSDDSLFDLDEQTS